MRVAIISDIHATIRRTAYQLISAQPEKAQSELTSVRELLEACGPV